MKIDVSIGLANFSTMAILITVTFLSFYQTALGQSIAQSLATVLPFIIGLNQLIFALMYGIFAGIISTIYIVGGKDKIKAICVFSFLPFMFSALPFSSVSWLSVGGKESANLGTFSFFLIAISGIVILFCLVFLNFLSKIKDTRKELFSRGGNPLEIETALSGSISYTLIITVASALLSATAVLVLMTAQPLGVTLIKTIPYATLIFGVGAVATITILVYYYLIKTSGRH